MCYSAIVKQQIKKLGLQYEARIDYELLQNMFYRRLTDDKIKISKALEAEFDEPENAEEREIQDLIRAYNKLKLKENLRRIKRYFSPLHRRFRPDRASL